MREKNKCNDYNKGLVYAKRVIRKKIAHELYIEGKMKDAYTSKTISKVVKKLKEDGYINNQIYLKETARICKRRMYGFAHFKSLLINKNIYIFNYEDFYSEKEEIDVITEIFDKKFKGVITKDDYSKIFRRLISRGFRKDNINKVRNNLL